MERRFFIKVSALATGGLMVGCNAGNTHAVKDSKAYGINTYVKLHTDNRVEVIIPVPEIGQGVRTSLAMLVAEELEIPWEKIAITQARGDDIYEGRNQRAAGSNSVKVFWEPMRRAGATVKELLLMAASSIWNCSTSNCYAHKGFIVNKENNEKIKYGDLAEIAATLNPPADIQLKSKQHFNILGTSVKNPDTRDITTGQAIFGMDVSIPDMVYASVEKCPTYGGRVVDLNSEKVLQINGVTDVFILPYYGSDAQRPYCREGVAVIGDSTWAVIKGRKALEITWDHGPNRNDSNDALESMSGPLLEKKGDDTFRNDGNFYQSIKNADKKLEATYHLPFIAHIPMEVVNCTIDLKEDSCEVWSTTQMPFMELNLLQRLTDLPKDKITVNIPRIGGGFGRRLGQNFTIEAVNIAKRVNKPVKLFWTREDDISLDSYRPFSYHKMYAGMDEDGSIKSWLHRQVGTSRYAFREGRRPGQSEFFPDNFPAHLVENFRQEYTLLETNIPRSLIRAPGNNALAFVVESFIDECAHVAGKDPLDYRLQLLGSENRVFSFEDEGDVISTERLKNVILLAAGRAQWNKGPKYGGGLGIAAYFTFNTYVAHISEVSLGPNGRLIIHRFVSAVDCGQVANINGVNAQVEGAINDGISATLYQEINVKDGATVETNFDKYKVGRMRDAPDDIQVVIAENDYPPTGMGEPPYPPVAPCLCNAIFAATGKRIRRLPIGTQLDTLES